MNLKYFSVNIGEDGKATLGGQPAGFDEFDINMQRPWSDPEFPGSAFVTQMKMEKGVLVPTSLFVGNATTGTLTKDEWKALDGSIRTIAHRRMRLVELLRSSGCVIPISNGLGTTVFEWESMSDLSGASLSMDGLPQDQVDRLIYKLESIPLPIISKNWRVNLRHLSASRNRGQPLSTNLASECARVIADYTENMFINGTGSFTYGGGTLYGLTDYPGRTTGTLSGDWAASGVSGGDILADVQAMVAAADAQFHYGPYIMMIPQRYNTKMTSDYRTTVGDNRTIEERLLALKRIKEIVYTDFFGTGATDVVLFEPNKETVAVVEGLPLTDYFYQSLGGWVDEHKVATITVPLIREDLNGQCGIVHYKQST